MSRIKRNNDDDHPGAAGKHLADALTLLDAGRADGAAYLSGYVVECALKSVLILEVGRREVDRKKHHNLDRLSREALRRPRCLEHGLPAMPPG